jgi:hypothetical protein
LKFYQGQTISNVELRTASYQYESDWGDSTPAISNEVVTHQQNDTGCQTSFLGHCRVHWKFQSPWSPERVVRISELPLRRHENDLCRIEMKWDICCPINQFFLF